jgi:hypothetical protein
MKRKRTPRRDLKTGEDYPFLAWGREISVRIHPTEIEVTAIVTGNRIDLANNDLLLAYMQSMRVNVGSKRRGTKSPYIQFANADTDAKLIGFVRKFGPVVVKSAHFEERAETDGGLYGIPKVQRFVTAIQDLEELRNERMAYRSAQELVLGLQPQSEYPIEMIQRHVKEIVARVSVWPEQWIREVLLRKDGLGTTAEPHWRFDKQNLETMKRLRYEVTHPPRDGNTLEALMTMHPMKAAHFVICGLINAFSPTIYPYADGPVDAPMWDLLPGLRPVLYYILRRAYLNGGSIGICRNVQCRRLFEVERSGSRFCSDQCSLQQRQAEYWTKRGKKLRKRRMKAKKKSKHASSARAVETKKQVSAVRKTGREKP